MSKLHTYHTTTRWTGAGDEGTKNYKSYGRDYALITEGKPDILGSSDPAFRGDPARHNPEDLLVSSLSACHMLWYLHLCAVNGVTVLEYVDDAIGVMGEGEDGAGKFESVLLKPRITLAPGSSELKAKELHHIAHEKCFIANSVNFPVGCEPTFTQS